MGDHSSIVVFRARDVRPCLPGDYAGQLLGKDRLKPRLRSSLRQIGSVGERPGLVEVTVANAGLRHVCSCRSDSGCIFSCR